jgi:hypothetical protein
MNVTQLLAPTKPKIITTILLSIVIFFVSMLLGVSGVSTGENSNWYHIASFILGVLNFGGGAGSYIFGIFSQAKTVKDIPFPVFILWNALQLIFQLAYLYLISCIFYYFRNEKVIKPEQKPDITKEQADHNNASTNQQ